MAMYSINCVVKYGESAGTALNKLQDVRWDVEGTEVDISTRDDAGFGATGVSLKRASGEIDVLYDGADAGFAVLQAASFSGAAVRLQFLDSAGKGLVGEFVVTNMSQSQDLEGALVMTFSVKLTTGGATWASGS